MREILIQEIESIVGQKPNTHRDFAYISRLIVESTHEYISPTTLKRVWGKQHDYTSCSVYTLDILARYLGYGDYKSFCQGQKMESEPSEFFVCSYSSELLSIGDELCLEWMPNRRVIIRYLGNQKYVVTASRNAKLSVNDTFECISFLDGQAIQLSHLIHNGQGPYTYIAGKSHGVRITPIVHKDDEITPPNQLKPLWGMQSRMVA